MSSLLNNILDVLKNINVNLTSYIFHIQEYKPDRFLPEAMEKMDNFAFIPFSAGPR